MRSSFYDGASSGSSANSRWSRRAISAALVAALSVPLGGAATSVETWLSDLPAEVVANVESPGAAAGPEAWLQAVFDAGTPFRFEAVGFEVRTDRRWWATAEPVGPGAPALVLRRWPGDTVLAVYVVAGTTGRQSLTGTSWGRPGASGLLSTDTAEVPVEWVERDSGVEGVRIAALLVPGGGGLGADILDARLAELRAAWGRLRIDPDRIGSAVVHRDAELRPPALGARVSGSDEREDPWRVFAGPGFTLGLPPGLAARRTDRGFPPPTPVPGGVAWLRGRFTDRDGVEVVVGDGRRAGYVAWFDGTSEGRPPVAVPVGEQGPGVDPLLLGEPHVVGLVAVQLRGLVDGTGGVPGSDQAAGAGDDSRQIHPHWASVGALGAGRALPDPVLLGDLVPETVLDEPHHASRIEPLVAPVGHRAACYTRSAGQAPVGVVVEHESPQRVARIHSIAVGETEAHDMQYRRIPIAYDSAYSDASAASAAA